MTWPIKTSQGWKRIGLQLEPMTVDRLPANLQGWFLKDEARREFEARQIREIEMAGRAHAYEREMYG